MYDLPPQGWVSPRSGIYREICFVKWDSSVTKVTGNGLFDSRWGVDISRSHNVCAKFHQNPFNSPWVESTGGQTWSALCAFISFMWCKESASLAVVGSSSNPIVCNGKCSYLRIPNSFSDDNDIHNYWRMSWCWLLPEWLREING
jgi:hypothetical protein